MGGYLIFHQLRDSILDGLAPKSLWFAPGCMLQNITGQPAMSLPTYFTDNNSARWRSVCWGIMALRQNYLNLGQQLENEYTDGI